MSCTHRALFGLSVSFLLLDISRYIVCWRFMSFFFCLIMLVLMSGCYICIELLDDGGLPYWNFGFVIGCV